MRRIAYICLGLSISFFSHAGGNPDQVSFPDGYKTQFQKYDTRNRQNGKQVAVLYANQIAINSLGEGALIDGSRIVMEIYKTKENHGEPVVDSDGIFQKGKFAAIAVMEKRSDWEGKINAGERAGDWGFAIYHTDGRPKDNNLNCSSCHIPMPEQDYMFSFPELVKFVKQ